VSSESLVGERTDIPDLLGVPEAAALLRVGLTFAYESTARYIATGSDTEIPAIKVGRLTRVPRVAFERNMGVPITWPIPAVDRPSAARSSLVSAEASPAPQVAPASARLEPAPRLFEI
jgi:hypothetical protein